MPAIQRGLKGERQHPARGERVDEAVHMPASGRVPRIEPAVVVGFCIVNTLLQFGRNRFSFARQFVEFGSMDGPDRRVAFHHTNTSGRPSEREVGVEALSQP